MTESEAKAIAEDMLEVGHFLFENVSWDFYEFILDARGRGGHYARITFDCGFMEVQTGADVERGLRNSLPQFLRGFAFGSGDARALVNDLVAADEFIYVISSKPGERDAMEISVTRSKLVPKDNRLTNCDVKPGPLTFTGVVRRGEEETGYPGIEARRHFEFVSFDQKGREQP